MKKYLIIILVLIISLEGAAVLSNDLFFEKVANKEAITRKMSVSDANAIKHAYAAGLVYKSLREILLSHELAKNLTIQLGKLNEIAEVVFKPDQDSSLEMLKDMQNNLIGIYAAKALKDNNSEQKLLSFVGDLAQKKIIILSRDEVNLEVDKKEELRRTFKYKKARELFDEKQKDLETKIMADLSS